MIARWQGRIRAWRQIHSQCYQGCWVVPRSSCSCICCRGGSIELCLSHPTVPSVYRPSAEVFLPLGCTEDQASSRSTVEYSGSTTTERIKTAMLSPLSSAQSRADQELETSRRPKLAIWDVCMTVMSTEVRTSRRSGTKRSDCGEQRRWKTCRQQEFAGRGRSDLRRFESFSPTSDDHTSANFCVGQVRRSWGWKATALGYLVW